MKLTPEQTEIAQKLADEFGIVSGPAYIARFLASLPAPEPVGVFANVNEMIPGAAAHWEHMIDESYDPDDGYIYLYKQAPICMPVSEQLPDGDGWILWKGGACPLSAGETCDVRLAGGSEIIGEPSDCWNWKHYGNSGDIIAYRAHSHSRPKLTAWEQCDAAMKALHLTQQAIALIDPTLDFTGWENAQGEDIGTQINAAIACANQVIPMNLLQPNMR